MWSPSSKDLNRKTEGARMTQADLPVAIIGAGPVGLAAAAHLLARGETPLVLEAGPAVARNIRAWGHVRMFTPWRYCVDTAARELLEKSGWQHPRPEHVPSGDELVRDYLEPLAERLSAYTAFDARVTAVTRLNMDKVRSAGRDDQPFVLRVTAADGTTGIIEARAVIDASGTWTSPNPAGADGLPAIGEEAQADRIASGIPDVLRRDRARYAGKTVAVVGSGHSALNVLIELAALREKSFGTEILWIMRKDRIETAFGGEGDDALPERGALGSQARTLVESGAVDVVTPFRISAIARTEAGRLQIKGEHAGAMRRLATDEIIVATGFRPDLSMLREIRLGLDPWLECAATLGPLIDPNLHSCGKVRPHGSKELAHPEKDFFIAGMKSYGRAPTFLLATGHEQVRSIAAQLTGDFAAAARVELKLPETGVCNSRPIAVGSALADAASGCCTPATPQGVCCPPKAELPANAPGCGETAAAPQPSTQASSCSARPTPAKETASICCAVPEQAAV
jgi:cation diffusion facilitator CzcD-associated flavoprotein CzcO